MMAKKRTWRTSTCLDLDLVPCMTEAFHHHQFMQASLLQYDCDVRVAVRGAGATGRRVFGSNSDSSGRRGERSVPKGGGWWFEWKWTTPGGDGGAPHPAPHPAPQPGAARAAARARAPRRPRPPRGARPRAALPRLPDHLRPPPAGVRRALRGGGGGEVDPRGTAGRRPSGSASPSRRRTTARPGWRCSTSWSCWGTRGGPSPLPTTTSST